MARCGCADTTCYCLVVQGANVTVTGNGSSGNPYVISADPATFIANDTSTVNLNLAPGSPDILTATVILDPAVGNLITDTGNGLRVDCAAIEAAACAVAGVGLTEVATSCGLTGNGTDAFPLAVNVETVFPFGCGTANGADVYCDTASGQLKVDPPHFRIFELATQFVTNTQIPITILDPVNPATPGGSAVGVGVAFQITNPSPCRPMILHVMGGIQHALISQPPGTGNGRFEVEIAAGVVLGAPAIALTAIDNGHQHWAHSDDVGGNRATFDTKGSYGHTYYRLPAGASTIVNMTASCNTIQATSAATIDGWVNQVTVEGWTI